MIPLCFICISPFVCGSLSPSLCRSGARPDGKDNNTLGRICQQVFFATFRGRAEGAYRGRDFGSLSGWKKSEYCDFEDFRLLEEKRQRINQNLMKKDRAKKQICKKCSNTNGLLKYTRLTEGKNRGKKDGPDGRKGCIRRHQDIKSC